MIHQIAQCFGKIKMASLMESYEQQYSNITAEVTSRIGQIPNLSGSEKQTANSNVEKLLEETKELLEQMDLEIRELQPKDRQKYGTRLKSYKTELSKLEKDLRRARITFSDDVRSREELMGHDDSSYSEDQRQRLLDNSERVERTSKRLDDGYRIGLETEQMGAQILEDLSSQRESIQRSRDRLRDTDAHLGKSSRVLTGMMKRIIQNRIILLGIGALMIIIVGVAIYFMVKKKS